MVIPEQTSLILREGLNEMIIQPEIQALLPDVTAFRRELHQIPELGLQEFQTIAYLKNNWPLLAFKRFTKCWIRH